MRKLTLLLGGLLLLAIVVFTGGGVTRQAVAAPDDVTVAMTGTAAGGTITYNITVSNKGTSAIGDLYVAGSIPQGATFGAVVTTPKGAGALGAQGNVVAWLVNSVPANGSVTLSYSVKASGSIGDANAYASWRSPTQGSAQSAAVSQSTAVAAGAPRRGCQACHVLANAQTGAYTLAFEAHERVEADYPGMEHPTMAPDGTSIKPTDQTGPGPCLQCHAPGTGDREGKGVIAPLALRDIVHPAHLFSETFKEHYGGTCFTCHNVTGDGTFVLLGDKVDTNEKGVPNSLLQGTGIIKGQITPSERGR